MHKAIVGLLIAGTLALVVAGCGGDDDSSISKQEYDQQIELICNQVLQDREEYTDKIGREQEQTRQKTDEKDLEQTIFDLIAIYQRGTAEIADLGLPEEDEKKAEELIKAREEAAARVEADPVGSLRTGNNTFDKANKAAEDLEAKSCAV